MDEDLLESASEEEEEVKDPKQKEEEEILTLECLSNLMRKVKELQGKTEAWDPYMVQSLQFKNAINAVMQTYKNLITTMKKQW